MEFYGEMSKYYLHMHHMLWWGSLIPEHLLIQKISGGMATIQ